METMYDNSKKSYLDNKTRTKLDYYYEPTGGTTRNQDYPKRMFFEEQEYIPKQQLISFLEDKIKNLENYAVSFGLTIDREIAQEIEIKISVYKNILNFVTKGGKDE